MRGKSIKHESSVVSCELICIHFYRNLFTFLMVPSTTNVNFKLYLGLLKCNRHQINFEIQTFFHFHDNKSKSAIRQQFSVQAKQANFVILLTVMKIDKKFSEHILDTDSTLVFKIKGTTCFIVFFFCA